MHALSIKPSLPYLGPLSPPSCSPCRRRCSLAVALSSCFRCNLSLTLSRFISVELHGEESFVAQTFQHVCKFEMHVYLRFCSFNLNFRYMASRTYVDRQAHASCNVVMLVWGSLRLAPIAKAHNRKPITKNLVWGKNWSSRTKIGSQNWSPLAKNGLSVCVCCVQRVYINCRSYSYILNSPTDVDHQHSVVSQRE